MSKAEEVVNFSDLSRFKRVGFNELNGWWLVDYELLVGDNVLILEIIKDKGSSRLSLNIDLSKEPLNAMYDICCKYELTIRSTEFNALRRVLTKYNRENSTTKTYIMKDSLTGLYKIGKSNRPNFREKTLQSEKPSIKMVKVFNKNIERKLHSIYKNQRVRGEWFDLNKIQLKYICTHY